MRLMKTALALIAALAVSVGSAAQAMEMSLNTTENYPAGQAPAAKVKPSIANSIMIDPVQGGTDNGDQLATSAPSPTADFNNVAPAAGGSDPTAAVPQSNCETAAKRATQIGNQ